MLRFLKDYDWVLISAAALLTVFGILMVYSASYPLAISNGQAPSHYAVRQLMWAGIAVFVFIVLLLFPYRKLKSLSPWLIFASIIALLLVILIGTEINGAQRWISLGPLQVQPSEFVKLTVIIYLAQVYSQKQSYIDKIGSGLAPPLGIVTIIFTFILLQPDLGTGASILLTSGVIVFLSGARMLHIISIGLAGTGAVVFVAQLADYRMDRVVAFHDPFSVQMNEGLQLIQSYIAIAHGGLTGTGLGESVQKMSYLPEPHTDMILAIVAEELGWLGIGLLLACFLVVGVRGLLIGTRCRNMFGSLLALGIVFQLFVQFAFNASSVVGLTPITGITVPFVSYGGSSLLVSIAGIAILANISKANARERREEETYDDGEPEKAASVPEESVRKV
ncbi:cell division-specific peptidoglycan biosynthesis regulator FtsW [Salsuginibacillus halophilus]|uniref:Probable peptidoglycan glycosyltransferase FtsW n=1 Tax=Salsuginibacillus halophilus TaxID=517424 RepID=A0A2P8HE70_9BACI|nr:putative lipid II flippase FtsW [Salsuginibacillus halophilus]PSL44516.1 cell division-specific peptidoglycan biosynthesis regulator FtsW [Salsuginibacillus halophilus]